MNYLGHFGLREAPFGITPDTSFFFPCRSAQEALNTLLIALENGEGFIKITGEVGTGKTLLCRKFLSTLDDTRWVSAYITNPSLEPRTLLLAFAEELSAVAEPGVDQHRLLKSLTRTLLELASQQRRVVLCLDESQAMPLDTLETLRLLTNLETEKRKLLKSCSSASPSSIASSRRNPSGNCTSASASSMTCTGSTRRRWAPISPTACASPATPARSFLPAVRAALSIAPAAACRGW